MMHHFTIFIDTFHYFQSRNGKSIASSFKRTLKPRTSILNTNVLSYDSVPLCSAKETPTFYYFFNQSKQNFENSIVEMFCNWLKNTRLSEFLLTSRLADWHTKVRL